MRHFIAVTVASFYFFVSAGAQAVPQLDQGLILHYTFTGNSLDQSPSANHATAHNATLTTDRFGVANSAYHFNGTGAYLQAAEPLPEADSITVSLWFNLDSWMVSFGAPQVLFFEGDDGPGRDVAGYVLSGLHCALKSDTFLSYGWLPPTNSWTHLVCVGDAIAERASIWINGRLAAETAFPGNANAGFHAPFNLGRRPGIYNDWFFAGKIDDVRVYNRPLSTTEITHLHNVERGVEKSLAIAIETVRLTLNVIPGRRYVLQFSADLKSWTTFGEPLVPDRATIEVSANVADLGRYWRLIEQPQ
jgi:hypothetical protein